MDRVPIAYQCRHYLGSKPCAFNKTEGAECPTCQNRSDFASRILFIKLDAIGDVLRSASMLPILKQQHPSSYIAWITKTESLELVRMFSGVDEVIGLSDLGIARIATGGWDLVCSLSNDVPSASLASLAAGTGSIVGFRIVSGVVRPTNGAAERWLEMAAFDRVKRQNTASYQRAMADILGYEGPISRPSLTVASKLLRDATSRITALFGAGGRRRVAINVGSGARWPKKMIDDVQIAACCRLLRDTLDVDVMLVGGQAEEEKTTAILALCGSDPCIRPVLTTASIPEFVAILAQADALLCGDTLALHVATALGLPTVAVFGPTSQAEIPSFDGLVTKTWAPQLDCLSCYGDCAKPANCMSLLDPRQLVDQIAARLPASATRRAHPSLHAVSAERRG